jgi:hypothetical protein
MQHLDSNWLFSGLLDFEYKKYTLLAYLQSVNACFATQRLFPSLSDLITHYDQLRQFKEGKEGLSELFPKEMVGVDYEQLKYQYRQLVEDDDIMKLLEEVVTYAIPLMEHEIGKGKNLYKAVEEIMAIQPVGIVPLHKNEGYLLLLLEENAQLTIYKYEMTLFESSGAQYRGLHTLLLDRRVLAPWHSLQNVKLELLKQYPALPNPATYVVEVQKKLPEDETLLPVAKRLLVRCLSEAA